MEDSFIATIREYLEFVKLQVGMYTDACSGFSKNKSIVERQVARVLKASGIKTDDAGQKIIVSTSFEDPSQPDIIHHRILRASDYLSNNSEGGINEQQHVRAIIIFLYTYWEDETRFRLAKSKNVDKNSILSDVMGDMRIIRHVILHDKGILKNEDKGKLKKLDFFNADVPIFISNEIMHEIFALIKQDISKLMLEHTGQTNGPVRPEDIKGIAIQQINHKDQS